MHAKTLLFCDFYCKKQYLHIVSLNTEHPISQFANILWVHPDSVSTGNMSTPHSDTEAASAWNGSMKPMFKGAQCSFPVLNMKVDLAAAQDHLNDTKP